MIIIDKIDSVAGTRFILRPNRSIRWRQLVLFYLLTCLLALSVGMFFMFQGIWLVLPFSGLEMLALGLGLYIVFRRTRKCEVITIGDKSVHIEKGILAPVQHWEFERTWVRLLDRISDDVKPRRKLEMGSHGNYVEVGNFLDNSEKDALVFRIKDCIIRA